MRVIIGGKSVETWNEEDRIICPYCGEEIKADRDMFDVGLESEIELECNKCGRTFIAGQKVSFIYETFKMDNNGIAIYEDEQ